MYYVITINKKLAVTKIDEFKSNQFCKAMQLALSLSQTEDLIQLWEVKAKGKIPTPFQASKDSITSFKSSLEIRYSAIQRNGIKHTF